MLTFKHNPPEYQRQYYPAHWALTPLKGKRPYRVGWSDEPPLPRDVIQRELDSGGATGVGLRTGNVSGGLLAVDIDGPGPEKKWIELERQEAEERQKAKGKRQKARERQKAKGKKQKEHCLESERSEVEQQPVWWTSGKEHRSQLLYQVPPEWLERLSSFTRHAIRCEDGGLLEFRYNGCQSVLPVSFHPETKMYRWILPADNPETALLTWEVALAPEWMLELLDKTLEEARSKRQEREETRNLLAPGRVLAGEDTSLKELHELALDRLRESIFDWDGHHFRETRKKLKGYCPVHGGESGTAFHVEKATGRWYCHGCGVGGHAVEYWQFRNGLPLGPAEGRQYVDFLDWLLPLAGIQRQQARDKRQEVARGEIVAEKQEKNSNTTRNTTGRISPAMKMHLVMDFLKSAGVRYNELTQEVESPEPDFEEELYWIKATEETDLVISKDLYYSALLVAARENSYHPVRDFLQGCHSEGRRTDIKTLATRLLALPEGTTREALELYNQFFYRHLIAAVARVFSPGCKKDEILILQGAQNLGKSAFWETLFGRDFFTDSAVGTSRDDLMVAHKYWGIEMAEFEFLVGRKGAGELKNFLSRQVDTFRPPYGRKAESHPRQFVFVGSVNPETFLVDETGNRRYWVVPVTGVNVNALRAEREAIWGTAFEALFNGESWVLPERYHALVEEQNLLSMEEDPWNRPVCRYLSTHSGGAVTLSSVLEIGLGLSNYQMNGKEAKRCAAIMRKLGWKSKLSRINGQVTRHWVKG